MNLRKLRGTKISGQSSKGSEKFWPKPKNDSDPVSGLENDQPLKVNNQHEIIYSKISAVASPSPYPCIIPVLQPQGGGRNILTGKQDNSDQNHEIAITHQKNQEEII